jgi:hypothetical protein
LSLTLFVGPSRIGKSFTLSRWYLPMLLSKPELATEMAPPGGYAAALVHDPRTPAHPGGQYPGERFQDVAAWLRATDRPRLACLEAPSFDAMCAAAKQLGGLVLVVDELERAFESSPTPTVIEMFVAARQYNSLIVGGCKRIGNLPPKARSNIEQAFIGNLSDVGDRAEAAELVRIPRRELDALCSVGGLLTQQGTFLEWHRASGWRGLTRVVDRRKITLLSL